MKINVCGLSSIFQENSEAHATVPQAPIGEAVSACNNNINCT